MNAAKVAGMITGAAAAVSVFAFRAAAVQLTPSQTLALYGDEIAAVYTDSSGTPHNVTFQYKANTLEWLTTEEINNGFRIPFETDRFFHGSSGVNTLTSWRNHAPALIYQCIIEPQVSDNSVTAEFELSPSINLDNIGNFYQYVFYSGNVAPDALDSGAAGGDWRRSWIDNNCPPAGRYQFKGLYNNAWQVYDQRRTYCVMRAYDANSISPAVAHAPMYGIYNNIKPNQRFTLSDQTFHLNSVRAVADNFGVPRVYLLIGCPDIDREFIGPTMPTTTAPAVTTTRPKEPETAVTYTTAVTIDDFQDDIQEIIRNQRWQIYQQEIMIRNQQVQNNSLRDILDKLDAIYVKMVQNNDVPISTDSPMWQEMAGALTGMTTNTMPNYVLQGLTFWADCSQEILTRFDFLVPLGAFALTMLVIYFVLFKGRTS